MRRPLVGLLVVAALLAGAPAAEANGFFGLNSWNPPSTHELKRMSKGGAGVYRAAFYWHPYARDWSASDQLMTGAAKAHIDVLPYLVGAAPPNSSQEADWESYVRDVVKRYKPGGRFWHQHPELKARPIRRWQIWNEPNLSAYWPSEDAKEYAKFFIRTSKLLKDVYGHARVVAAGVPESTLGVPQQTYFKRLYKVKGFRGAVDLIAVHAYAADYTGVLGAVQRTRDVMSAHGDSHKPIWVTETGWATGGEQRPWTTSRKGQAKQLHLTAIALLHRRSSWHIHGMVWFSWRDTGNPKYWGNNTGVFDRDGKPKPSWAEFAEVAGGSPGSGGL